VKANFMFRSFRNLVEYRRETVLDYVGEAGNLWM
jgi:hypothetical protein